MQKLIAQDEYAKGTWIHFCTSCKHLENFILSKFNQKDLLVTQIDFAFISDFEFYLKRNICAHNTAMKYLSNFRKIVLLCLKNGWLPKDPFLGYKLARKEVHREVLTDNDLKLIAEKLFSTDRLT